MESDIIDAWQEARRQGKTVGLMANSTEAVIRLNGHAQHTRLTNGESTPVGQGFGLAIPRYLSGTKSSPDATTEPYAPIKVS
jgi:hypothetical protein